MNSKGYPWMEQYELRREVRRMLCNQVWFQQTKNESLELKSERKGRQDGLDAGDIIKKGSIRWDGRRVVIAMQEEKGKIFASLHDWKNELLIETEKSGEISSED